MKTPVVGALVVVLGVLSNACGVDDGGAEEGLGRTAQPLNGVYVLKPNTNWDLFAVGCSAIGAGCCDADRDVPTDHCIGGLGCNVATKKCEACGGPGQVCCDGPTTEFSGRSYAPNPFDATGQSHEMCHGSASCDARLVNGRWEGARRCTSCGTTEGGACCPPDPRFALGRCQGDPATPVRLTCADPRAGASSTCVRCGRIGLPACNEIQACDNGSSERDGMCVACGSAGQAPCDDFGGCNATNAIYDLRSNTCVAAGGKDQPCNQAGACNYQHLHCEPATPGVPFAKPMCRECGQPGEACCPGDRACNGKCIAIPNEGDRCYSCGGENAVCCDGAGCDAGLACSDGACRRPPVAGGGLGEKHPPKTCGGQEWGFGTTRHVLYIELATKCVEPVSYDANSAAEARSCAASVYGDAVLDEPPSPYEISSTGPTGLCEDLTVSATSEEDAATCGSSLRPYAVVQAGRCP